MAILIIAFRTAVLLAFGFMLGADGWLNACLKDGKPWSETYASDGLHPH